MLSSRRLPLALAARRKGGLGVSRVRGFLASSNYQTLPYSDAPHPVATSSLSREYPAPASRRSFGKTSNFTLSCSNYPTTNPDIRSASFCTVYNKEDKDGESQEEQDTTSNTENSNGSTILSLLLESEGSVEKSLALLQEMIRDYDADKTSEKPTATLLESLLRALVEGSTGALDEVSTTDPKEIAKQAQILVDEMNNLFQKTKDSSLQPTLDCYSDLILAWKKADNPQQTERVFLEQMLGPDSLKAMTVTEMTKNQASKKMRVILGQSLNHVLESWANSGLPIAGKRCDQLLQTEIFHRKDLPVTIKPNPESHHLINQAWIKAVENNADKFSKKHFRTAALRVQENVNYMLSRYNPNDPSSTQDWLPAPESYPWLILTFGYAGNPKEALAVLDRLIQYHSDPTKFGTIFPGILPRPTTQMYNHVLEAYAVRGQGKDAGLLLSKFASRTQIAREKAGKDPEVTRDCEPNLETCLWAIKAWGLYSDHYRAPQAEQILTRMWELQNDDLEEYMRVLPAPTTEVCNAVLEAWSHHRHYKLARAVTNAERLLFDMHHDVDKETGKSKEKYQRDRDPCWPNSRTYELVLETYARFGYKMADRKQKVGKLTRRMQHWSIPPTERCSELVELCQEAGKTLD